jgi:DNA processing protein
MIKSIDIKIDELSSMKKYPKELYYKGNIDLLNKTKVSIVGSRKPIQYTKNYTYDIAKKLSARDVVVVSGAAMGVDAIAHQGAGSNNTIAVMANGLDIRYPAVNKNIITDIENNGLVLSQYKEGTKATRYSFPIRNEVVVALGEVLIVTQADINSGTMRSIEHAINQKKDIYILPHRLGDSDGTNSLIKESNVHIISDIDSFISLFGEDKSDILSDSFLEYVSKFPTYEEAVLKYQDKVFEYELLGKIIVENGIVKLG